MNFSRYQIILLAFFLIAGTLVLGFNGLKYGLDFSGGTEFILTLDKPVTNSSEMSRVVSTVSERLDWSGLKDVTVSSSGDRYIVARVAVSSPEEVASIEKLLQEQGRFENVFESKVLFTGDDILNVVRDPKSGYSVSGNLASGYNWSLPFTLNSVSARRFAESVFHKCVPTGLNSGYDCPKTYFFIDRPVNSLILIPREIYQNEQYVPADPLFPQNSNQVFIDEILQNSMLDYMIYDSADSNLVSLVTEKLKDSNINVIIVPTGFNTELLEDFNVKITVHEKKEQYPWIWTATGLRSIIWLTQTITNEQAQNVNSANFQVFYTLSISGSSLSKEEAQDKLSLTSAILSSGSLPVGIESISKEVVNPTLGSEFLKSMAIMGFLALLAIALVLYIRYRDSRILIPMVIISISEIYLTICFASLIKWQLDLTALAGIVAAVGTGVDDQIIVTDEVKKGGDKKSEESLAVRIKIAFSTIFATAGTTLATMLPIIFFGFGLGKLVGFAITTISGVLIGVLITRPAYAELIKQILAK